MAALMIPLSMNTPSMDDTFPTRTNFWTYAFLQQGLWNFSTAVNHELFFHASFSAVSSELAISRKSVWAAAYIVSAVYWLTIASSSVEISLSVLLMSNILPMIVVISLYFCVMRSTMNQPPHFNLRGLNDLDVATHGADQFYTTNPNVVENSTWHPAFRQFVLCSAFCVGFAITYIVLDAFAVGFQNASGGTKIFWFFAFVVINIIMKDGMCRIGLQIDMGKRGSASLYYCAEVMCSLFYYSLYRFLFESVESFSIFFALMVVHIAAEWFSYAFRSNTYWFRLMRKVPQWLRAFTDPGPSSLGFSDRDWACYRTNAFGIRMMVFSYSSVAYFIMKSFVVYGYNKTYFGSAGVASDAQMQLLGFFLGVSALIEMVNAAAMNMLFFRPNELHLLVFMSSLVAHGRPYEFQLIISLMTGELFCNLFIPFVVIDFGGTEGHRIYTLGASIAGWALLLALLVWTAMDVSRRATLGPAIDIGQAIEPKSEKLSESGNTASSVETENCLHSSEASSGGFEMTSTVLDSALSLDQRAGLRKS